MIGTYGVHCCGEKEIAPASPCTTVTSFLQEACTILYRKNVPGKVCYKKRGEEHPPTSKRTVKGNELLCEFFLCGGLVVGF